MHLSIADCFKILGDMEGCIYYYKEAYDAKVLNYGNNHKSTMHVATLYASALY